MKNIFDKFLKFFEYNKNPSCNYQNKTRGIYCSKHKLEEMVDVKHKKCSFGNCDKYSSCNYQNKSRRIYYE